MNLLGDKCHLKLVRNVNEGEYGNAIIKLVTLHN